jgi:hypothetical protein
MKRLLAVLCLFLGVVVGFAQEDRGRISGLVSDPTGAVVPNAFVTLINEATKVSTATHANGEGLYTFPLLVPGLYTVDVKATGFKEYVVHSLRVEVAANVKADAKLTLGESTESVTVTATNVNSLKTDDAVLGTTIEARSFNDLPELFGNSFTLQLLAPGVTSTSLQADYNHTYEAGPESASINGAQTGRTEFTLDGAPDTRNAGSETTSYTPSRDFINEFRLITSPYDASMAHTSGGSLDGTLKSGGSQFHGGISANYQDPHMDAPLFSQSTAAIPYYKFHRESGNVGGPILRKKLFFFSGYEHQYNQEAASTSTQTVPTVNEKKGDFSELLNLASAKTTSASYTCNGVTTKVTYNSYQLFNPYSTTPLSGCSGVYQRQPISGNVITNVMTMDPVAAKLVSYYPDPNTASTTTQNNYVSSAANHDYYWSIVERLDYTLNEQQKMFGHYIRSRRRQPGKNLYFPGASGKTNLINVDGGLVDYVNTLSNTSMLNARLAFTRTYTSTTIDAKTTATDLGINSNATAGISATASGFPYFYPSGYAELGNADPAMEADNIADGQVTYSKVLGRHQLKIGAEWRRYQANYADYTNEKLYIASSGKYVLGPFNSNSAALGASLASIEMGLSETTKATLPAQTTSNTSYWSGFIQDDWKVLPKLTVNVGVRYEYFVPLSERNGKSITYFDTSVASPISAAAIANYTANASTAEKALVSASAFSVNGGLRFVNGSDELWNAQHLNFSPRVGFAYNPIEKLVVRGGFGIFYQHIGQQDQYASPLGYSQSTSTTASNDNGQTYVGTLQNPFPNGLTQPTGNTQGLYQNIGSSISTLFVRNPKTPYSEQFSLGFQYALPKDLTLEANYIGTMGRHLKITRYPDATPDSILSTDSSYTTAQDTLYRSLAATYPNPFYGITVPASQSLFTTSTISGSQLVLPYPEFTSISGADWGGMSSYNALQVTLSKRFSHGYNMSVGYTQSRLLDAITFLNNGDAKPWYGVSNTDYPRVLTTSAIYELPFGRGKQILGGADVPSWLNQLVSGFQISGTYRIQSGQPLTFGSADTKLATGMSVKDINGTSTHNYKEWFNIHAFNNIVDNPAYTSLTPGVAATMLRSNLRTFPLRLNNVRADYQNMLNLGALRRFKIYHDRYSLECRGDAVNALNHQVYASPNTTPSSTSFGYISGPGNYARRLQVALVLSF